jgi:hypothetical protein
MGEITQQIVLDELRRAFDQYTNSADRLDEKANGILSVSNVFIGLFALLQLILLEPGQGYVYWVGIIMVLVGYSALIWVCTRVLTPREYKSTIAADWETLSTYLLEEESQTAYDNIISTYIESISQNRRINQEKARYLHIASRLFPSLIMALFMLSLMPR